MIKPELIKWARERARAPLEKGSKISSNYEDWEKGTKKPNLKQIEAIANKFHVPFGYLFLSKPPEEKLPITDFRTIKNKELKRPSNELLETIYDAQRKQEWLREEKLKDEESKVIQKQNYSDQEIIHNIKTLLEIETLRKKEKKYEAFLKALIEKLWEKNFLVIRNGVVGNSNKRGLDEEEFQGFALFDEYAPLIFINGKDYVSRQIFTLVHEVVHLFLNESGVDGTYHLQTERKCNRLAAEVLVPRSSLKDFQLDQLEIIAERLRVSVFVVLLKAKHSNFITASQFEQQWEHYEAQITKPAKGTGGGNYYFNVKFKAGGDFFLARVRNSTLAGETLYREAYSLTGLSGKTFDTYYQSHHK